VISASTAAPSAASSFSSSPRHQVRTNYRHATVTSVDVDVDGSMDSPELEFGLTSANKGKSKSKGKVQDKGQHQPNKKEAFALVPAIKSERYRLKRAASEKWKNVGIDVLAKNPSEEEQDTVLRLFSSIHRSQSSLLPRRARVLTHLLALLWVAGCVFIVLAYGLRFDLQTCSATLPCQAGYMCVADSASPSGGLCQEVSLLCSQGGQACDEEAAQQQRAFFARHAFSQMHNSSSALAPDGGLLVSVNETTVMEPFNGTSSMPVSGQWLLSIAMSSAQDSLLHSPLAIAVQTGVSLIVGEAVASYVPVWLSL